MTALLSKPRVSSLAILIIATAFTLPSYAAKIKYPTNTSISNATPSIDNFAPFLAPDNKFRSLLLNSLNNLQEGNTEESITNLKKAWNMQPNNIATGVALATIHIRDKDFKKALVISHKLQEIHPNKPESSLIEDFVYLGLNDPKKSSESFTKALETDPGNPIATANLANYALNENKIKQAKKLYNTALKYNPGHVRTLVLMARLEAFLGNNENTKAYIEQAMQKFPDSALTHNNFALLYGQFKLFPLAIKEIEKAVKIEPNNTKYEFEYAKLLTQNSQYNQAQDILSKLILAHPNKAEPRELSARIALAQNKPQKAIDLFSQAYALSQNSSLVIQLATAQKSNNQKKPALTSLSQHISNFPNDIAVRTFYAEQLRIQNHKDEAIQQYKEIINQQPGANSAGARNNLAVQLSLKGEIETALTQAKKAHQLIPTEPNIMDTYAVILMKKKRYEEAFNLLQIASKKLPKNPSIRFHLAQALAGMKNNEEAKKILSSLIEQNISFSERNHAQKLLSKLNTH